MLGSLFNLSGPLIHEDNNKELNITIHVKKHEIVLDGTNGPIVSDHFGVMMEEE